MTAYIPRKEKKRTLSSKVRAMTKFENIYINTKARYIFKKITYPEDGENEKRRQPKLLMGLKPLSDKFNGQYSLKMLSLLRVEE